MTVMLVTRCSYARSDERFAHHLVDVDHRARRVALAREGQQVADDARGALGLAEDGLDAAARGGVEIALGEALGPREDRRERVVQLVRDARDGGAEGGHLLGLQQLVIEVARLVLELLAIAHVAHQRLDAHVAGRFRAPSACAVTSTQMTALSARRRRSR